MAPNSKNKTFKHEIMEQSCTFEQLPNELIIKIFEYTPYENIGTLRQVCKKFNEVGSFTLNSGFKCLRHKISTSCKSNLANVVQHRRKHLLSVQVQLLSIVDGYLYYLETVLGAHIAMNRCCFFPAKILDEVHWIYRQCILWPVSPKTDPFWATKITRDFINMTMMAVTYFDRFIKPRPLQSFEFASSAIPGSSTDYRGLRGQSGNHQ